LDIPTKAVQKAVWTLTLIFFTIGDISKKAPETASNVSVLPPPDIPKQQEEQIPEQPPVIPKRQKFIGVSSTQKTGSQTDRYDLYTGVCSAEGGVLTGTYASGTPWGSSYKYKVTGTSLTLTSSDLMEEQIYDKESLPEGIKVNADTKSAETAAPIL
jgi:hypothetical protein